MAKVKVFFGSDSLAGKAVTAVDRRIDQLKLDTLHAEPPWDEATRTEIQSARLAAEKAHEDFLDKAHYAIRTGSVSLAKIAAAAEMDERERRRGSLGWWRFYRRT